MTIKTVVGPKGHGQIPPSLLVRVEPGRRSQERGDLLLGAVHELKDVGQREVCDVRRRSGPDQEGQIAGRSRQAPRRFQREKLDRRVPQVRLQLLEEDADDDGDPVVIPGAPPAQLSQPEQERVLRFHERKPRRGRRDRTRGRRPRRTWGRRGDVLPSALERALLKTEECGARL